MFCLILRFKVSYIVTIIYNGEVLRRIDMPGLLVKMFLAMAVSTVFISDFRGPYELPVVHRQPWHLVLNEEFEGEKLNPGRWVTCYDWFDEKFQGCSNNGNQEQQWYTPEQVSLKDGILTLTAKPEIVRGWTGVVEQDFLYKSGMVSTGRSHWDAPVKSEYKYGYFEARMKTTSGRGVWPAFWLLPSDKQWPPEIDVMEILGDKPHEVLMTNHWGTAESPHKDDSIFAGLEDPNGWHTYGVDWQPGIIDWYIDGVRRKSVISEHVPSEPMEIILNLAIGGKLPGNPDESTPFPATLEVDYVRVFQLPNQLTPSRD